MASKANGKCWCGLPLHYDDKEFERQVCEVVERFGEYITVEQDGRKYLVQRHWIALHKINGKDLSTLGFREVDEGQAH
jgi:hypothetical protein